MSGIERFDFRLGISNTIVLDIVGVGVGAAVWHSFGTRLAYPLFFLFKDLARPPAEERSAQRETKSRSSESLFCRKKPSEPFEKNESTVCLRRCQFFGSPIIRPRIASSSGRAHSWVRQAQTKRRI